MRLEEAEAWLRGERSMINQLMDTEVYSDDRQQTLLRIAEADAAMTKQAYFIVRAHREGLLTGNTTPRKV